MFHVVQPQAIQFGYMVIIESVVDLSPILAAAHQAASGAVRAIDVKQPNSVISS